MSTSRKFVVCSLDDRQIALEISKVERVVRAVEITPVPEAPPALLGVIKVKDRIIPVINARGHFALPDREVEPSDVMIIVRVSHGEVALLVDAVAGLIECRDDAFVPAEEILHDMRAIEGVVKTADGLVVIEDLDKLLPDPALLQAACSAHE